MAISKVTLAKEVDGKIEYLHPRTSADIVEYTNTKSVKDKLDSLDSLNTITNDEIKNARLAASDGKTKNNLKDRIDTDYNYLNDNKVNKSGSALTGSLNFTNVTEPFKFTGAKGSHVLMLLRDTNNTAYGVDIGLGAGGTTVICSGDCTATLLENTNIGSENLILGSDYSINFYTGMQNGIDKASHTYIDENGVFHGTATNAESINGYTIPDNAKFTDTTYLLYTGATTISTSNDNTSGKVFLNLAAITSDTNVTNIVSSHKVSGSGGTSVSSSNGNIIISSEKYNTVTETDDGLMLSTDKIKLDNIPYGRYPDDGKTGVSGSKIIGEKSVALGAPTNHASGYTSIAMGTANDASGTNSVALGVGNNAIGAQSIALGDRNTASSTHATAIGSNNTTSGGASFAVGRGNTASGEGTFTVGTQNTGSGDYSVTIGQENNSIADYSFTAGYDNKTGDTTGETDENGQLIIGGVASTALGYSNLVYGDYSSALGRDNTVSGKNAFAAGKDNTVKGTSATAIGENNTSLGQFSFTAGWGNETTPKGAISGMCNIALGYSNTSSGIYSIAAGKDNESSGVASVALGGSDVNSNKYNVASGDYSTALGCGNTSSGMYSFTAGKDNESSAEGSVATGKQNTASNLESVALGFKNTASGARAVALGNSNNATLASSVALGFDNTASGEDSFAAGDSNIASGDDSIAMGCENTSSGTQSFTAGYGNTDTDGDKTGSYVIAIGRENKAIANYSTALGNDNTTSGAYSFAAGRMNEATSSTATALGYNNKSSAASTLTAGRDNIASGENSIALGYTNTSSGKNSVALGVCNEASGYTSFTAGYYNKASYKSGDLSGITIAMGCLSEAVCNNSAAIGTGVKTSDVGSFVCGIANNCGHEIDDTGYCSSSDHRSSIRQDTKGNVFVVGNGYLNSITTNDDGSKNYNFNHSNAFRVTTQGAVYSKAAYNTSGADYAEFIKEWYDGNPNNEDRVGYMVTVKDGKLHKANSGDYIIGITSGNPSIVGNADEEYYWKYERDRFNRIILEDLEVEIQKLDDNGNPVLDDNGDPIYETTIIKNGRMKLSDNYDSSLQLSYIERSQRPEWDYVGMRGVVPCRDDGTCEAGGFCKCGTDGIATKAEAQGFNTYFVIERIDNETISVEVR